MANVAEECLKKLRLLQTSSTAFVTGELKRMESVLEIYVSERKEEKNPGSTDLISIFYSGKQFSPP